LDAVFCHDITTPIAINDLVARGKDRVFDATKIKAVIDHVTPAKDSKTAEQGKIMREWARRHGIKDFFDIGHNGVCHAIFPEKGFVRPGYTVIMGDSHTCTHGASGLRRGGRFHRPGVGILKGVCAFATEDVKVVATGSQTGGLCQDVIWRSSAARRERATDMVIEFTDH
jgi:3-isopropylmalate/(R)-2-methylmalate dehydratase large subunit